MWYNELLLVLMAFLAVLMIVMATVVVSQGRNRVKTPKKVEEEEKVEKILVEKGFERKKTQPIEEPMEVYDETIYEPVREQQEESIYEPPTMEEPEPAYSEPELVDEGPEPIYSEPEPVDEEPEQVVVEAYEKPDDYSEPEAEPVNDENVVITPVEPIILETEYKELDYGRINGDVPEEPKEEEPEPVYSQPVLYESPDAIEPDESVVITPNQTFYDPVLEEEKPKETPMIEEPPMLEEENPNIEDAPIEDIPEIALPPLEPDEPTPVPEEIEPDVEEEPAPEPTIIPQTTRKPRSRIRKPVIDESDPNLRIDLGVNTCPYCGSKVPDTIYCIYCGKPLNPNDVIDEKEEEN